MLIMTVSLIKFLSYHNIVDTNVETTGNETFIAHETGTSAKTAGADEISTTEKNHMGTISHLNFTGSNTIIIIFSYH